MLWPRSFGERPHPDLPDVRTDVDDWCVQEGIARPTARLIDDFYLPMTAWIADHAYERTAVVAINGAQGTGKSTLARLLARLLDRTCSMRAAILSLDDLYLTAEERRKRSESIHPLLATRGVPGTHDVELGCRTIDALRNGQSLSLPRFDKAEDDRLAPSNWPRWRGPCDVVLFEGWCVGARPQRAEDLDAPVNDLEASEDRSGEWRWYVNRQLGGPYQKLFCEIDLLIMIRPRSFDDVYAWRERQEARLRERGGGSKVMSAEAVRRFVMHYERLTRFMWEEMPARADAVVHLGADHCPTRVELGDL